MENQQIPDTIGWLGETWGFWIQTGALVLSALAAVAVIYSNGRQARKRATIDLMLHQKNNQQLLEDTRKVWDLAEQNGTFAALAKDTKSKECIHILRVLNGYEFVALGIRKRAFDENIYKMSQFSNVMKVWRASDGFIRDVRASENKPTLFQELEWLTSRWEKDPIYRIKHRRSWQFWKPD
ncbi:DUF4760 domain-containing protein [Castellaniella caeni]|uniref:DUF4760 domain-containing protein n=1 Tax=Castellaniella caeni TaxID=266123 RepID=UPI000C9F13D3|nr:DUF4760 domain-containing protein [Castellaniella caeni]